VRFDDPVVLFQFLPAFIAIYYLIVAADAVHPRLAGFGAKGAVAVLLGGSVWLLARSPAGWLLLGGAALTIVLAAIVERTRAGNALVSRAGLALSIAASLAMFAAARARLEGSVFAFAGVAVLSCHQIALVVDVYRGRTGNLRPAIAGLYLVQFPLLPAGPLVRYQDIERHWRTLDRAVGLGAFTYGMRRLIIGLLKVAGIAAALAAPVDAIFTLPPAKLTTDAAWLAAACFSLQLYFQFSGYADIAIGLGRMFGLRYVENFHRPYLADSLREFWRRWHVTSMTWLRDYLAFPIAGRDTPTLALLPNIVAGFVLLGFWYGAGWTVGAWAAYSSAFLALEAIGFGARLARWPPAVRHLYVLLVVMTGWVILRAGSVPAAVTMLETLAGIQGAAGLTAGQYVTPTVAIALALALVGAGPLIPWISRWRVSLDAVTAALVMMVTSVSLFLWRGAAVVSSAWSEARRSKTTKT
jgi:D-alanyl-lipoteichoic acid acyltransferase DltB (MBOAT superfamily)